ncbi:MAG TPA: putative glycolipid-binding domain-containing protein [Pyrinomonadaceae bacterium]|nr:putative glycolipid-binding domain-containing protein [Pyrinomonadaceae bacterium]
MKAASISEHSILWRRLDKPGHESARLICRETGQLLIGTAIFAHDGLPCRLDYQVVCDAGWQTLSGKVEGWVGERIVEIDISVDSQRRWRLNGEERPEVRGCTDLDLNFSPSTNLLPLRRLGLTLGQCAEIRAAWLRFPSFTLKPLEQNYTRVNEAIYRYESAYGRFVAELKANEEGFIIEYPGLWEQESV